MNKIFYIVLIVMLVGLTYGLRNNYAVFFDQLHPCDRPITYKIDTVDKQFNLSRDQFVSDVGRGADLWNMQAGKKLFLYDPQGKLSVNLIFDQRQQEQNKINALDNQLQSKKDKLAADIGSYRANVANFKNRLAQHNSQVAYWNSQGGAPQEEFDKLNTEQTQLKTESDQLNATARKLNLSTEDYNLGVGNLKSAINNFNEDLQKKPEEGIFKGDQSKIEIYFNNSQAELIHTISHELGHALGLEHNSNSKSVMFPYTNSVIKLSTDDAQALGEVCRNRSIFEVISNRLQLIR